MDSYQLKQKITEFDDLLSQYEIGSRNGKLLWDLKNEIFNEFKEVRFEAIHERQNAWQKYRSLVEQLKEKQQKINQENELFAKNALEQLEKADRLIPTGGLFSTTMEKADILTAKEKLEDIFQFIKNKQWPTKQAREQAWEKFTDLKERLKKREDEHYAKKKERFFRHQEHSQGLTEKILGALHACDPDTPIDELMRFMEQLITFIMTFGLAQLINALFGIEEKPKHPLRQKSDALKDVRKMIDENLNEFTPTDRQKVFAAYHRVRNALNQAWTDYKEESRIKNEERAERQKEKAEKNRLWEKKQWEFVHLMKTKIAEKQELKTYLEDRLAKQISYLASRETRLENQKEYLKKVEAEIEDLEQKYEEAWSDSYRERSSDWIEAKQEKKREVEQSIDELESKIDKVESDIKELESKIESLESAISNMTEKMQDAKAKL